MGMEEQNGIPKDEVRIDLYKVNDKILREYPPGTPARDNLVKMKKLTDLKHLSHTMDAIPEENVRMVNTIHRQQMIISLLIAGLSFGIGLFLLGTVIVGHHRWWDFAIRSVVSVGFLMFGRYHLHSALESRKTYRELAESYRKLKLKFHSLVEEISKLG